MNVIVVVCNSLHLGFLGAYGNSWIETPHLDRLAAEGVVFDYHFPENLTTLPTRRSWWTGRYGFPDPEQGWTPLRPDETILPDLLWSQGVRTALISDVPLLREVGQGYGRGFDEVIWIRGQGYDPLCPSRAIPGRGRSGSRTSRGCGSPPRTTPTSGSGKSAGSSSCGTGPVLRTDVEENTGVARTVQRGDRLARTPGGRARPVPALARPVQPARPVGPAPALPRPVRHRRARRVRGRRRRGPDRGTRTRRTSTWKRSPS